MNSMGNTFFKTTYHPKNCLSVEKVSEKHLSTREICLKIRPNHVFNTKSSCKNGVSHGIRPSYKYL